MHRRATLTAWWADRPGRNPNDDPEKSGSKMGVSTCAIACWISLSRQVGTPSKRSPPPGLGITTRRTGEGRYVPASRACRTGAQCSRSHGTSSSVVMPSTPGAPPLALTRLNARPRFSGESIRSHKLTSRPGMTASSGAPACRYAPPGCSTELTVSSRQQARVRGMAAITATSTSNTDSSASPDVRPFPAAIPDPRPVLRPLLTSARSAPHLAVRAVGAATPQHNRHPGRPPRIRTTTFPLRPPRLRDDPVGDDGLCLLEQAHPDRPASYAVRVPRCRDSPRASFPPRLTTTQLPPARS